MKGDGQNRREQRRRGEGENGQDRKGQQCPYLQQDSRQSEATSNTEQQDRFCGQTQWGLGWINPDGMRRDGMGYRGGA